MARVMLIAVVLVAMPAVGAFAEAPASTSQSAAPAGPGDSARTMDMAPAAPAAAAAAGSTESPATPDTSAAAVEDEPLPIAVEGKEPSLHVRLRGRIHADAIFVNQSQRNQSIFGNIQDAVGFRRARLGAEGSVGEQVRWVSEFDFAGGNISFKDVFIAVEKLPFIRQVRVGHFPEPFSLEGEISTNGMTFVERSPINAIDPDRNWGVALYTYTDNERLTFAFGAFRSGTDINGNDIGDGNDMAFTARITGLPWYDEPSEAGYLMHVGAAFSQRFAKNGVVTFTQSARNSLLQPATDDPLIPFVSNIAIPATQNQLYNVQWALVLGSLSLQAEWYATTVDQVGGGGIFLHGSYIYASYFLTGEHRLYDRKGGSFGRTQVIDPFIPLGGKGGFGSGPGAWEFAFRFAYLDYADRNIQLTSNGLKQGDRLAQTTIGINWYLNDYARIMFNYMHVIPVDPNFGPSAADAFFIRSEIFW